MHLTIKIASRESIKWTLFFCLALFGQVADCMVNSPLTDPILIELKTSMLKKNNQERNEYIGFEIDSLYGKEKNTGGREKDSVLRSFKKSALRFFKSHYTRLQTGYSNEFLAERLQFFFEENYELLKEGKILRVDLFEDQAAPLPEETGEEAAWLAEMNKKFAALSSEERDEIYLQPWGEDLSLDTVYFEGYLKETTQSTVDSTRPVVIRYGKDENQHVIEMMQEEILTGMQPNTRRPLHFKKGRIDVSECHKLKGIGFECKHKVMATSKSDGTYLLSINVDGIEGLQAIGRFYTVQSFRDKVKNFKDILEQGHFEFTSDDPTHSEVKYVALNQRHSDSNDYFEMKINEQQYQIPLQACQIFESGHRLTCELKAEEKAITFFAHDLLFGVRVALFDLTGKAPLRTMGKLIF